MVDGVSGSSSLAFRFFLRSSSGPEGQAQMANWLKGGFEMDRNGNWRLKPQVADTLQRDVQAIMAQTGWQRSIARSAQDQVTMGTNIDGKIGGSFDNAKSVGSGAKAPPQGRSATTTTGQVGGSVGFTSSDVGIENESATANLDIVNYDVRNAIREAERVAARSDNPEAVFANELGRQISGDEGLRSRYLENARAGRGTSDVTAPITSIDQRAILGTGRFSLDLDNSQEDGSK